MTISARQGPVLVVWNRTAGTKVGVSASRQPTEAELRASFERHGLDAELVATTSAADAVDRVREACARGYSTVVAAGGDGTARAIARELLGTDTALGILPLGSVMNLARSLGIPRDLDPAVAILARRTVREIDVGMVGPVHGRSQPFFESVSIGLHAALFREGQRFDRGHRLALPRAAWIMLRYRPSKVWLELDDRRITTRALAISIANAPYAGLGFTVAPDARLDDGRLDIRIFRGFSRWQLVRHFASIIAGRRAVEPRIETVLATRIRVFSRSPLPVRPDDDPPMMTPVSLELLPCCLRVIAADAPAADLLPPALTRAGRAPAA